VKGCSLFTRVRGKSNSTQYAVAISWLKSLELELSAEISRPIGYAPANVATNESKKRSKLWRLATSELPENLRNSS
jgi:hypothetical protein